MKKLILLALTLGILWAVGAQATDPPVFQYDATTGQYYYNDDNGQPVYLSNDIPPDAPVDESIAPPADTTDTTGTTTDTTTGTATSGNGNEASSGDSTTNSSTTGNTSSTSGGTSTTTEHASTTPTETSNDHASTTPTDTSNSTGGNSGSTTTGTTGSTTNSTSSTTGTTGSTTNSTSSTTGTTGSTTNSTSSTTGTTGSTTNSTSSTTGTTGSTTDTATSGNTSNETPANSPTDSGNDTSTSNVTVDSVPDYADYWITACPNYLTQIDLNAKEKKVAAVLSIEGSKNSHVTDNKDGTLSYIPNKDFTNGVDTLSITYQTPQGDKANAIIKARMQCKEVLKTASCKVYISHNSGHGNTQFVTLDPEGHKAVTLGPMYRGYDIEGLVSSPKTHLLYALSGGIFAPKGYKGELYLVDPTSGNLSIVGNTGFPRVYGLAARADGSLWAWVHTSTLKKPGGILQIDPDTAISSLKFTSTVHIDGLAWSSDGKTLYGGEGKNLWAWKYDGETFTPVIPKGATQQQPVCSNNLPFEVEGLAALQGNMLLFGGRATKEADNQLLVFNPLSCKAVITHTFTNPKFDVPENLILQDSMEGIVWAEDCQPDPKVTTAEIQQFDDVEVCDETAGWQSVVAKVHLTPSDSKAYVKTSWSIINPSGAQCPTGNEDATAPCEKAYLSSQIVEHDQPFSIDVWWPGMTAGKKTEVAVSTQVYDMEDNPLNEEVTHYLTAAKCDQHLVTREAIVKNYLASLQGVDSFDYNYTDDGIVATLTMGGQARYRVEITPVAPAALSDEIKDKVKANSVGSKDENDFAPLVRLIFADNKRAEARFSQINTITYKRALTNYLAQITAKENIEFGANGALTVIIDGETYKGTLFPALTGGDLASEAVEFTAVDDIDGNGHTDFIAKYADGVEQTVYITAVPGSDEVQSDEVIEQPVIDDNTGDGAAPSDKPSDTVKDDNTVDGAAPSDKPSDTVKEDNKVDGTTQPSDKPSDTVKEDNKVDGAAQPSDKPTSDDSAEQSSAIVPCCKAISNATVPASDNAVAATPEPVVVEPVVEVVPAAPVETVVVEQPAPRAPAAAAPAPAAVVTEPPAPVTDQ